MLTDADLNLLVTALRVNNSARHSSSLKFGKLMLSTVLAYGSKVQILPYSYFVTNTLYIMWNAILVHDVVKFHLELAILLLFFWLC